MDKREQIDVSQLVFEQATRKYTKYTTTKKSQIQIQKNVKFSLKQGSDKSGLIDWVNWISGKPQASKPNSTDLLILCLYLYS